jgi:hypothetical protein
MPLYDATLKEIVFLGAETHSTLYHPPYISRSILDPKKPAPLKGRVKTNNTHTHTHIHIYIHIHTYIYIYGYNKFEVASNVAVVI